MSTVALGLYRPAFPNELPALHAGESVVHWYALWGGWKSAFSRADLEAVSARGAMPLITWEPWAGTGPDAAWSLQNAILSGRNDAYIRAWAKGMAAYGKPVWLRFAHEMHHQPSYPWSIGLNGNTADDYVAAWRHVRAIFRAEGAANVRWIWNPNTLGTASAATYLPVYRSLYPGDAEVDFIGLDIYNTGPQLDWGAPTWRSFSQVLREPYAAITSISNKPLILPEVGSTELGGSKSAWIADMLERELPTFERVVGLVWFDINKEQAWSLGSSRAALEAWAKGANHPRYIAARATFS